MQYDFRILSQSVISQVVWVQLLLQEIKQIGRLVQQEHQHQQPLLLVLLVSASFALVCAGGLSYVQLLDSRKRQVVAEQQRLEAEQQEQEAAEIQAVTAIAEGRR